MILFTGHDQSHKKCLVNNVDSTTKNKDPAFWVVEGPRTPLTLKLDRSSPLEYNTTTTAMQKEFRWGFGHFSRFIPFINRHLPVFAVFGRSVTVMPLIFGHLVIFLTVFSLFS
jgi:hypothetical protein